MGAPPKKSSKKKSKAEKKNRQSSDDNPRSARQHALITFLLIVTVALALAVEQIQSSKVWADVVEQAVLVTSSTTTTLMTTSYKSATASTNEPQETTNKDPFERFSCREQQRKIISRTLEFVDPNGGRMNARQSGTSPKFWVSEYRNSSLNYNNVWKATTKRVLVEAFEQVLTTATAGSDGVVRVFDIGAGTGYFSLFSASKASAATRVVVDAFETSRYDRLRFCEAISLNRWYSEDDIAGAEPTHENAHINLYPFQLGNEDDGGQQQSTTTRIIRMDDLAKERGWMRSKQHFAILKLGFAPAARIQNLATGAKQLLNKKLIENVLLELSANNQGEQEASSGSIEFMVKTMSGAGYKLKQHGHVPQATAPAPAVEWNEVNSDKSDGSLPKLILKSLADSKHLVLWWTSE